MNDDPEPKCTCVKDGHGEDCPYWAHPLWEARQREAWADLKKVALELAKALEKFHQVHGVVFASECTVENCSARAALAAAAAQGVQP